MRLIDVARASLVELMGDYEMALLQKGEPPWRSESPQAQAVAGWRLDPHEEWADPLHDSGVYILAQRVRIAKFLDADESTAANTLLILCRRAIAMLTHLLKRQGEMFAENGGFRERMRENRMHPA